MNRFTNSPRQPIDDMLYNAYSMYMPKYTDAAFKEWMEKVNSEIGNLCGGLSSDDLEDINYADMFESGDTPNDAAREALGNSGFPIDDDY